MRKIENLEKKALKFWPESIAELERNSSIIPRLIVTQDKFISLLNVADKDPFSWKDALAASKTLSANLFLKHLMILSDIGGERLKRFKRELSLVYENNKMEFSWNAKIFTYNFITLSERRIWDNAYLKVDGNGLANEEELTPVMEDIINLLLFGGASTAENVPSEIVSKCTIGNLIGRKRELDSFVKQRYIWVSRITGGATANSLGHIAQKYVVEYLKAKLPKWNFDRKEIPKMSQNKRTPLKFDIVAKSPKNKYCALEVSFQVTTNSTIERKAGQAQARKNLLNKAGHKIAYIIDGAGNFERSAALNTISQFSDCIVTFKDSELNRLARFLKTLDKK